MFDWTETAATLAVTLAGLAIAQGLLLLLQTIEHRRFALQRLSQPPRRCEHGVALVFVPCKGLDLGLAGNLEPLFEQDHPDYRLVLIVASADDPASTVIRSLIDRHPRVDAQLLVAGRARDCGQKVHGLLCATDRIPSDVAFLAFADSDVRTGRDWLRRLTERLDARPTTGAVTGYRWLVPGAASPVRLLLDSLNNSVATLFGAKGRYLLWGGCWAIRRELFDELGIRDAWRSALSDDLTAARVLHAAGRRVKFEPACMLPARWDANDRESWAFLRRQFFMLRNYAPEWWWATLAGTCVSAAGFWFSLLIGSLMQDRTLLVAAGLVYAVHTIRGAMRLSLARLYLSREMSIPVSSTWFELFAGPVATLAALAALVASAAGRKVRWRGIEYRLDRHARVIDVRRGRRAARELRPIGRAVDLLRRIA